MVRVRARDPRRLSPWTRLSSYAVVDTETTGLDSSTDALVEIGAVVFRRGVESGRFSTLIDPGRPLGAGAARVTGLEDWRLAGQPSPVEAYLMFDHWLGDPRMPLVAHNAGFDMGFLDRVAPGGFVHRMFVDTLELDVGLHPSRGSHSVESLVRAYGIGESEEHRALSDAVQESLLYRLLLGEAVSRGLA